MYLVSADHVMPQHGCKDVEAIIGVDRGHSVIRWYATIAGYGCSKSYASPEAAIRGLLSDHACTNITIRKV